MTRFGTTSLKLSQLYCLPILLGGEIRYTRFYGADKCDIFIGWGYKNYAFKTKKQADYYNKPFYYIEDGFLRSLYSANHDPMPLSVIVDTKGAYYDAGVITDLEEKITTSFLNAEHYQEAKDGINYFKNNQLAKYVITTHPMKDICPEDFNTESVVIIDQTAGDASLEYGGVTTDMLEEIASHIKQHFSGRKIYLKTHPDILAGKKQGCLTGYFKESDIIILPNTFSMPTLLVHKPHIVTLTSLAGFEALLYGCNVTTYGLPWYAGYGVTQDLHPKATELIQRRSNNRDYDVETLFYVSYILYPVYFNPATLEKGSFWDIAHYLSRTARHVRDMSGTIYAIGFRPWKQKDMLAYLRTPFNKLYYVASVKQALRRGFAGNPEAKIVVWSYKNKNDVEELQKLNRNAKILRFEDGFIRSFGLGSDFIPPFSLAIDNGNLYFYYGEGQRSDIQKYLSSHSLPYFKKRAENLLQMILYNNITKYNLEDEKNILVATNKKILLVVGQVDDDESLIHGCLPDAIRSNYDMLKYARHAYPNHFIIYKPHPDVLSGNRRSIRPISDFEKIADYVENHASVIACITQADDILCMTSLVGFDALLRGKNVNVLGKPFYAAYYKEVPSHLVQACLIDYPLYINTDNVPLLYGTPERVIAKILRQKTGIDNSLRTLHLKSKIFKRFYQLKKWILG